MKVTVGISNRHVHLTKENMNILFGRESELTNIKDLNQPKQFKAAETVTIKTEKSEINNVRIIGPIRNYTQIEISKTDAYKLGLNPPVRNSGELENSERITIIGPKGSIDTDGVIIATRHIHVPLKEAEMYNFKRGQLVRVKFSGEKGGIVDNVSLRVSNRASYEMHIDTDDANAHFVKNGDVVEILEEQR